MPDPEPDAPSPRSQPSARDAALATHSWLGVLPLAAFAAFHLWQQWPALDSRAAWVERASTWQLAWPLGALVLAVMAAHAWLGLRAARSERALAAPHALAGFQRATGLLVLGFLLYHLSQVWPPARGPHASVGDSYDVLWSALGTPAALVAYVLGVSALAFHLATGLARFAERRWPRISRTVVRYCAGALGLLLWLGYLQVVGRFAIGEEMLPMGGGSEEPAPPPTSAPPPM